MDHKELQEGVNKLFLENFGRTPLTKRLKDIEGECRELCNYIDLKNLKEEAGDLLASVIQLCNESEWDIAELLEQNNVKITKRALQYKSMGRKIQVAILGGAFNPVTKSHIGVAELVLKASRWADEVWLMPSYKHMDGKNMVSAEHRINMLKLATKNDGRIKVSEYEIENKLGGETYFMLSKLLNDSMYENYRFAFVIGLDRANYISNWYNSDELLKLDVPFIVVPRNGYERDVNVNWYLNNHHIYLERGADLIPEFSSTKAREVIKRGTESYNEIKEFMNEDVLKYIIDNHLYC